MKNFCIILFFVVNISCNAQDKKENANYNKESIALNNESVKIILKGGNRHDNLVRANQLLDSAINIDPSYVIAYGNKIQNLLSLKEYHLALDWSDSLLSIKPGSAETLTGKGLIYDKLGDTSRAQANYNTGNQIYKTRYNSDHSINNLKSLAFNYYLLYGKAKAFELITKEEYRFKNSPQEFKKINQFKNYLSNVKKEELFGHKNQIGISPE